MSDEQVSAVRGLKPALFAGASGANAPDSVRSDRWQRWTHLLDGRAANLEGLSVHALTIAVALALAWMVLSRRDVTA